MGSFMNKGKRGNESKPFVKFKKTQEFLTAKAIRDTISSMMTLEDIFFSTVIREDSFIKEISEEDANVADIVVNRLLDINDKSKLNIDEYSIFLVLDKILEVIINYKDSTDEVK